MRKNVILNALQQGSVIGIALYSIYTFGAEGVRD